MKIILCITAIIIIAIITVILESIREHKDFKVKTCKITNDKISDNLKGTRFVVFSDLHNACYGEKNEKLFDKIKDLKPDFIILAGDMPVANTKNRELNMKTAGFIARLSDIADIYYGIGNHEKRMSDTDLLKNDWQKFLKIIDDYKGRHKIYFMNNKKESISKSGETLNIYGLDLELSYYQRFSKIELSEKSIEKKLGLPDSNGFNILIAHNPDYFKSYAAWGADLVLSGHVHGGMIRLPILGGIISPKPRFFPHYDYGEYKESDSTMLLSNGLGSHSIKIRINNIPELLIIELKKTYKTNNLSSFNTT